ncbi:MULTISPECIES: phage major tail tube protein [unclassified Fusobacterium]|uniref:phage major tail tube protein n=1 Tax=unclassified Fusobacterium TaxID=2648384 RepID=UPI001B8C264F|nr:MULTISPECIES: phage major tail tube protein [unclassified Fusobacterium]MBR8701460.1 hypothetical protein [Fusobacterium sp. DD45]MBR8711228.1 hypothetical protein [Fusobacterium sp. DD28]MBR8751779.1 hypothetical protein [Fusobacterium sp. DD26]
MLASIIEDAIVRLDGSNELVGVATIGLPDIEHKTETISGLGVIEHDVVLQTAFNAMKMTFKFTNRSKTIALPANNINLVIKAQITGVNPETHEWEEQIATYSIKGKKIKTSGGELGKAVKNETEIELALTYFKEVIDDVVVTEIDVYNRKAQIDGVDLYEKLRNNLQ